MEAGAASRSQPATSSLGKSAEVNNSAPLPGRFLTTAGEPLDVVCAVVVKLQVLPGDAREFEG
jgi:hypothetical protein